jgi:hypothetical protein
MGTQTGGTITDGLVPRAVPLAGPGQSPGLTSLPGLPGAGNGHEVYRAARADGAPVVRVRRPADRRSRIRRWDDTIAALTDLQTEYAAWLEALPDNQQDSALADALRAIVDLDLSELVAIEPPRGFGRD